MREHEPDQQRFLFAGIVRGRYERKTVSRVLDVVKVIRRALWSPVRNFSGGNQQKIAVAKWLLTNSRVLLLYDPTRGIDVGTKTEIYHLIRRYTEAGGAARLLFGGQRGGLRGVAGHGGDPNNAEPSVQRDWGRTGPGA